MEKIKNNINISFQNLFKNNKNIHPFFVDIIKINKLAKSYINDMKKFTTSSIEFNKDIKVPTGTTYSNNYSKILKIKEMYKLQEEMNKVMNWDTIHKIVSFMSYNLLQSTVSNEMKLYKDITNSKDINIMIIGSGPVGLFLACYLKMYYNNTSMNSSPRVNVVLYDSKIVKPGFRKPYNRYRPFATSSNYINLIIPKIYCWNSNKNYIYINIFMLEYLLYTIAVTQYKIPIIYNDYDWDEYKNIIDKGNFKVVFDCTGGRLKHDIFSNINTDWINSFKQFDTNINKKLIVKPDENLVILNQYKDSKFIQNHYYASITVHNNDKMKTFVNKYDIDITNKHDLIYINQFKHKTFTYLEVNTIIEGIKNDTIRNFLYSIFTNKNTLYKEYIFMIDCWEIYIRHAIQISEVISINNKDILYVGAGDTIFHSHFITGAGLNRTLDFTVKCANMLQLINE
jgi:hypothetical protein